MLVIALAISGGVVRALSLRDFLVDYVDANSGGNVQDVSPEDTQTSVTTNEISSIDPKNAEVFYSAPGLAGSYKATLTIDVSEHHISKGLKRDEASSHISRVERLCLGLLLHYLGIIYYLCTHT